MKTEPRQGVVQSVAYTHGGAGNQWTTIDGVKYATWWDIRTRDWKEGDLVDFDAYNGLLWHGNPTIDCATNIRKARERCPGFDQSLAELEGWGLFEVDGRIQLQRDDALGIFDCDADALLFVALKAHNDNSGYHYTALEMVGQRAGAMR